MFDFYEFREPNYSLPAGKANIYRGFKFVSYDFDEDKEAIKQPTVNDLISVLYNLSPSLLLEEVRISLAAEVVDATPEEIAEVRKFWDTEKESRYQHYLDLKKEFEPDAT